VFRFFHFVINPFP